MYSGNLFHTSGAALEKDLSPNVFKFLRGTSRRHIHIYEKYVFILLSLLYAILLLTHTWPSPTTRPLCIDLLVASPNTRHQFPMNLSS